MDLSVVVVTFHSKAHILGCLRSLESGMRADASPGPAPAWDCVVMDNDSRDGTPELVESDAPWARVVRTGANLGYAKAVNRGIAESRGEFVLVLNPDCEWRPGSIHALMAWLRSHEQCAIAAPRILNPDGSLEYSARAYPDSLTFLFNRYCRCRGSGPAIPGRGATCCWTGTTRARAAWTGLGAALPGGARRSPWARWTRRSSCSTRTWTGAGA
jgi:GT2 family glycosyltransferase